MRIKLENAYEGSGIVNSTCRDIINDFSAVLAK